MRSDRPRVRFPLLAPLLLAAPGAILLSATACGDTADATTAVAERAVLENGATLVRYASLPPAVDTLSPDLTIGVLDGEDHEVFGDVRGIEADAEGRIYVLDAQTTDVRVFAPDGTFLRRIGRRGEGPGEIRETNGMVFDRDGVLWVHDHGAWRMVGFDTEGNEVARTGVPVLSYAFLFTGAIDHRGRFWKTTSHSDEERVFPPQPGLQEGSSRMYAVWHDPVPEAKDSVFLFESSFRTYVSQTGNGWTYWGVPFENRTLTVFDPAGGLWASSGGDYRLARLDEHGDTILVLEAAVDRAPVSEADRAAWIEQMGRDDAARRRIAREVLGVAGTMKPALDQIMVDDESRLWVRRVGAPGEPTRWDVFGRDGDHVGSVVLGFETNVYFPPRIRNGRLYALTTDELDVPRIVRATLPDLRAPAT